MKISKLLIPVLALSLLSGCALDQKASKMMQSSPSSVDQSSQLRFGGKTYYGCPSIEAISQHASQGQWTESSGISWAYDDHGANIKPNSKFHLYQVLSNQSNITCYYKARNNNEQWFTTALMIPAFDQAKVAGYHWQSCQGTHGCQNFCKSALPSSCVFAIHSSGSISHAPMAVSPKAPPHIVKSKPNLPNTHKAQPHTAPSAAPKQPIAPAQAHPQQPVQSERLSDHPQLS